MVYLPVFTEGALLAAGDLHGLMGDGEIGYSGLETDGRVTLKVELVKGAALAGPMVINRGRLIVVASDDTLDAALVTASLRMCDFLVQRGGLPAADAVRLLTLLGDAGICQAVNPQKTAKLSIPVREFAALGLDHSCGISL